MKKIMWLIVAAVVLAGLYFMYARSLSKKPNPPMTGSKVIALKVGESTTISLDENTSTGFKWEVESYSQDILKLESSQSVQALSADGKVGAPGSHYFVFKALKPGNAQIKLKYSRSWEDKGGTIATYNVIVTQ